MLIVDPSPLDSRASAAVLPEEKKALSIRRLKSCHCFIRTSISLLILQLVKRSSHLVPMLIQQQQSSLSKATRF